MLPVLPAEVQDEIVDHLSGKPLALKRCALTCRQWARRAQKNLFRVVNIIDATRHDRVKRMLIAHPRLAQFVRVLRLSKRTHSENSALDEEWPDLLLAMDRVETLDIGFLNLFPALKIRAGPPTHFPRVRFLCLLGRHNLRHKDFLRLIAAFSSVEELTLSERVRVKPHRGSEIRGIDLSPMTEVRIRTLTIPAVTSGTTSCLLHYLPLQKSLRRLQLHFDASIPVRDYGDLLRTTAPALEELVVRAPHHWPLKTILQSSLPFERLRRLHLKDAGLEESKFDLGNPHWMITALTLISLWERRSQLREIVLSIPWPGSRKPQPIDFNRIRGRNQRREPPNPEPLDLIDKFPFEWVQFNLAMMKLAQENDSLVFIVNIRDPALGSWGGRSRREHSDQLSRMHAERPHALTVFIGACWATSGFGGRLVG
ncbi:hypothetical protein DAEQUDRAFT_346884 [Daedalea quercina L-15889]|uniref:F-box domain-containing protein n=1 Tax=Daedalea quercina L-15889 TaxID=1314783 RepID=A0A165PCF9_9APHY|nr:hypothetical protein DAEQUDRAFT_346884 [Daedalea quercina L-15889]